MNNRKSAFQKIYDVHSWGGTSRSGPGSDPDNIREYIKNMNKLISAYSVQGLSSICEIGCGDWATTRHIEISKNLSYSGIDIVPELIASNQQAYGSSNVRFICADAVEDDIPEADIIIIKDVLQHLSNESVKLILSKSLAKGKILIVTNDILKQSLRSRFGPFKVWRNLDEMGKLNQDIKDGGSRPIDITIPPFCIKAVESIRFNTFFSEKTIKYVKEMVVISGKRI